jgi:type IV pilus assembly protein PilV
MAATDAMNNETPAIRMDVGSFPGYRRRADAGFTLLEVLVTMVVLAIGLLGLFGLQTKAQKAEIESYQRTQALVLIQDMVDRMNANRADTFSQGYVTASPVGGGGTLTDCSGKTGADLDLCEWGNLLRGAAETAASGNCTTASGAACIGAMTAARGCIAYDATTELADSSGAVQAGTGLYTITIVWEGLSATTIPSARLNCGTAPYGARMVNSTLRIAALGAQ